MPDEPLPADPQPPSQPTPLATHQRPARLWGYTILLLYVLVAGAALRFLGLDWGEYQYLHPDERFLIWVGSDISPVVGCNNPELGVQDCPWYQKQWISLGQYFDTDNSPLNPHNRGHGFYVYGTLPMFLTRLVVEFVYGHSGFNEMSDVGRALSALFDWLAILVVFFLARRLYDQRVGVLAAAFYAFAVLPIQQAHFFTMDTFISFFTLLALYFAVRVMKGDGVAPQAGETTAELAPESSWKRLLDEFVKHPFFGLSVAFGLALGCAVASKLNAAPVAAALPLAFGVWYFSQPKEKRSDRLIYQAVAYTAMAAVVSILVFRVAQPYAFKGLTINPAWWANIHEQRVQAEGDVDFPPALQWARRTHLFSGENLTVWGLGLPLGLLAWAGVLWAAWRMFKGDWQKHLLVWGWTVAYFLWQSMQFNPTMRYQLPIYPTLAVFAAWAVVYLYDNGQSAAGEDRFSAIKQWGATLVGAAVLIASMLYAGAFVNSVYLHRTTRVAASYWIYENIPGPINVSIGEGEAIHNQPLPFPSGYTLRPDYPYQTTFDAKSSGPLAEIYLPYVREIVDLPPLTLELAVVSPEGGQPMATSTLAVEPESLQGQAFDLPLSQVVSLIPGQSATLVFTAPAGQATIDLCGTVMASIQSKESTQFEIPAPAACTLAGGQALAFPLSSPLAGDLFTLTLTHLAVEAPATTPSPLTVSMVVEGSDPATSTLTATAEPTPAEGRAGWYAYRLSFAQPPALLEGKQYTLQFSVPPGAGILSLEGTAIANEGDWDDGLPVRVEGYDGFGGIYQGGLNFNMYTDDNPEKLAHFLDVLSQTDYILISSNRQWGSLPRLPERFPMSVVYYRNLLGCPDEKDLYWCYSVAEPGLFQGNLGFELVKVFQADPRIGPLRINTQFAEEAFTVYDHPKVLIFRKTANFNLTSASALLGNVDFSQVVHLTPKRASNTHPADLLLPADRLAEQRAGGTWSELFDVNGLLNRVQILGLVVWYLVVALLGLVVYPLVRLALPGLADRGYPLARIAGMVLLAWLVWMAASLRIPFNRVTITLAFILMAALGGWLAYRQRDELIAEWKSNRRYYLIVEGLFLAFFVFDLVIRLANPDLWHPWKGGEKPMDFAYLNAVIKSTTFPPYDPWYSGGYLNYYYYGFVIVGVLVKWLGILPSIAYNLILPTLFSLTAMGAFSVAWNLVARKRREPDDAPVEAPASLPPEDAPPQEPPPLESTLESTAEPPQSVPVDAPAPLAEVPPASPEPLFSWRSLGAGLAAAVGMVLIGNLGTMRMIVDGWLTLGANGRPLEGIDLFTRLAWAFQGAVAALQGMALPYRPDDWYWIPSRVMPGGDNAITEFPLFTFLYADPHAHLFSMAIALLALAWAVSVALGRARWQGIIGTLAGFFLGALAIGALYPANTWDYYTYLAIGVVAVIFSIWRNGLEDGPRRGETQADAWKRLALWTAGGIVLLVVLVLALYRPFSQWFFQAYSSIELLKGRGPTTPVGSYLTHWGLFLFVIVTWLAWETRQWMAGTPLSSLRKLSPYRGGIYAALILLVGAIVTLYVTLDVSIAWLVLPLAAWAGVVLLRPGLPVGKRVALFLIGTGLVITLMVEIVVVKGDIGRQNTVFKFYLQAWALFAVCCAAALGWMIPAMKRWLAYWRIPWIVLFGVLVASAALFTLYGGVAKAKDRMTLVSSLPRYAPVKKMPLTLDGMDFMQYVQYNNLGTELDLSLDYNAIRWMQQNVKGSPVIVEAASGNQYYWFSRFSIYTGLPDVVGWQWHQQQQRPLPSDPVSLRVNEVAEFYQTVDLDWTRSFLKKYAVQYIIVGGVESGFFPGPGLLKFEEQDGVMWREVYRGASSEASFPPLVIYEVIEK